MIRALKNGFGLTDEVGAKDQLADLLPVLQQICGTEHRDTLDAGRNLAIFSGQAGEAAQARDQLTALLPVCERLRGAEHPDTVAIRQDLALWAAPTTHGSRRHRDHNLPRSKSAGVALERPRLKVTS